MANTPQDVRIRPMRPDDVAELGHVAEQAAPDERLDPGLLGHLLDTDPGGCWVAEDSGEIVGFAIGIVRELMWVLASYAVLPGAQHRGIAPQLYAASAQHGQGCLRGLLTLTPAETRAARHHRAAGFTLHPLMKLTGTLDRATLPLLGRVREGTHNDLDLLDSLDRRIRGAAHGPDHLRLCRSLRLIVVERTTGSGYAYLQPDGNPVLLAATNRRTAGDLLWEALASAHAGAAVRVDRISAANQWALDVGLAAGLTLGRSGYLGVRRIQPPAPYLPHPTLL
jgi:GNAT superfamily N-acetyltransferase